MGEHKLSLSLTYYGTNGATAHALRRPLFNIELIRVFTARCTIVQSAVFRLHVVCLSVCHVGGSDHIGWKSWKVIPRTVSAAHSLFVAQRPSTTARGTWENFGEPRGGVGKQWRAGAQKRQYL